MTTAVQQIMLGQVTGTEAEARKTLTKIKAAGYDAVELNRFMIHPTGRFVRLLTRMAGMPAGAPKLPVPQRVRSDSSASRISAATSS